MAIKDKKISVVYPGRDVTSLSDRPNQDGLTAAQLKARFDQLNKELFPKYNELIDELNDDVLPLKADKAITVNGHPLSENVVVTKADVGLGNADNTSDADKPLSIASTNALALKADKAITINGHALSENVVVSKADVGLGNADNTSDANKPVSTAQAEALALKADKSTTYTKTEMQTSGSSLMHWDNLTNKPNFGDFHWKAPVANRASLPLTDNVLGDNRVVLDDGDGKQAVYTCIAITGDVDAQWSKVADVDWMTEEQTRITQELARVSADNARASAEGLRVTAESGRVSAEGLRATAEGLRVSAESTRVTQETGRVNAENVRLSSETLRIENEIARNTFVEYSGSTAYQAGNKVSYLGSSYVAKSNTTGNLPTNTTYWLLIAQKGDNTTANDVTFTPTGNLSSTNVQTALAELDSEKASKLFATNLVTNGDFSNGTTGWSATRGTIQVINGELILTGDGSNTSPLIRQSSLTLLSGQRYYIKTRIKFDNITNIANILYLNGVATPTLPITPSTNFQNLSFVDTFTDNTVLSIYVKYTSAENALNRQTFFGDILTINLTQLFGAGNEPTKEQMDWLISQKPNQWFDGTTSLVSTTELIRKAHLLETTKVDVVSGKGLSTNDYTSSEKNKVSNLPDDTNAQLADKASEDNDIRNYIAGNFSPDSVKSVRKVDISEWNLINADLTSSSETYLWLKPVAGRGAAIYVPAKVIEFEVNSANTPYFMVGFNETSITMVGVKESRMSTTYEFDIANTTYIQLKAHDSSLIPPAVGDIVKGELTETHLTVTIKRVGQSEFTSLFSLDLTSLSGANGWDTNPQIGLANDYTGIRCGSNVYRTLDKIVGEIGDNVTDILIDLDAKIKSLIQQVINLDPLNGRWTGKTLNILGDSFTQRNLFPPHIKSALGLATVNLYGSSGDTIAVHPLDSSPMSVRYTTMTNTADLIVVEGGVNDYGNGAFGSQGGVPIGTNADTVNTTFKGALKILIAGLLAKYPTQKIAFVAPIQMNEANASLAYKNGLKANTLGHYLIEYVDAMKEICALYGIPCLDMYRELGLSEGNMVGWTLDGLHLNDVGSEYYGLKIAEWLKGI